MLKYPENKDRSVYIAGKSGFIGKFVADFLQSNNFTTHPITRKDFALGTDHIASKIDGCYAVINLAGAPIQSKWTKEYKQIIYNSRINTTRSLVDALKKTNNKPKIFISSSAVGIYNAIDTHDEFSDKYANDFLGNLCRDWEAEAYKLLDTSEIRLVIFRFGIVLAKNGGAFPKIIRSFRLFAGSKIGDGHQWFPYMHIDDVLSAFWFVFANTNAKGVYNLVVPNTISYNRFCQVIAKVYKRPYWLTVPKLILKLIYGEGIQVLITGQHVKPHRLVREGFYFQYPNAQKALTQLHQKK